MRKLLLRLYAYALIFIPFVLWALLPINRIQLDNTILAIMLFFTLAGWLGGGLVLWGLKKGNFDSDHETATPENV